MPKPRAWAAAFQGLACSALPSMLGLPSFPPERAFSCESGTSVSLDSQQAGDPGHVLCLHVACYGELWLQFCQATALSTMVP